MIGMPQHKSAAKRMRQNARRRARNKPRLTRMRRAVKAVRTAPDKKTALARLREAVALLDKIAAKGTIHKNKASRLKSRLTKAVNAMPSGNPS